MINELLETKDNWERVRDQIAAILKLESENQQTLAVAQGKDPEPWRFRVFVERSNPMQLFQEPRGNQQGPPDNSPVIHVSFNGWDTSDSASNLHSRQRHSCIYWLDCVGCGVSGPNPDGGHLPGDRAAALNAQRTVRFCRQVIMSEHYQRLGFAPNDAVIQRMPRNLEAFAPMSNEHGTLHIVPMRLQFNVALEETSPAIEGAPLEIVATDLIRIEDGEVLVEVQSEIEQPSND